MSFTIFDIVLLLLGFGFLAFGFAQGLVKMGIGVIGFYLALLISAVVSDPFARWAGGLLKVERVGSGGYQILMFFLVLLTLSLLIIAALFSSVRVSSLPKALLALDQVGGMVLGAVFGLLVLVMLATLIKSLVNNAGSSALSGLPLFGFLFTNAENSITVNLLYNLTGVVQLLLSPIPNSQNLFIFH